MSRLRLSQAISQNVDCYGCVLLGRYSVADVGSSSTISGVRVRQRIFVTERTNYYRRRRLFSSSSSGERLRVAVVGGGAAGLSSALHLAPLVTQGLIAAPIDVYEPDGPDVHNREIGVGVWSTALDAFHPKHRSTTQQQQNNSSRVDSHELVYQDLIKKGTFIKEVGYRTPKGHWLAESCLGEGGIDDDNDNERESLPQLLFLKEKDLLSTLRKAVHLEQNRGTINLMTGKNHTVQSVMEDGLSEPWSAPLLLQPKDSQAGTKPIKTERDYHLIVAADGMNSVLRKVYGGHIVQRRILTGTYAMGESESDSPLGLPSAGGSGGGDSFTDWYVAGQSEATSTQDRHYTVFRGSAPIKRQDLPGELDISFQTWGEGRNMRFATVPMGTGDDEKQVWFITIDDDKITSEKDPAKRRDMLLDAFSDWHAPIADLVKATPPQQILMERALAHKHSMRPVDSFYRMVHEIKKKPVPSYGQGPVIQFVGDAFMTVDPILAQGLTVGMEGAASLGTALSNCLDTPTSIDNLAFDPYALRVELQNRHEMRLNRLIHLLRATELVQALGQPTSGTISGLVSRDAIRPLMRVTPSFIKTPIFNATMMYSLGLPMKFRQM